MKKYWRGLAVALLIAEAVVLSGCLAQSGAKPSNIMKIGVLLYRGDDTFIQSIVKSMETYASALSNDNDVVMDLKIEDAKRNQSTQNKQVENFLSRGYDVVCVNPVDRTMANFIINKAEKANVPIIFFNREPVASDMALWNRVYYVGADARQSGEMLGKIVVDAYYKNPGMDKNGDGRLQYVLLEGEPSHQDSLIRTEESLKTIKAGGIFLEKLASDTAEWERGIAAAKMLNWIDEFGDQIELVMSNNDDMALGAIDALREREMLENGPKIIGIDGTDVALQEVVAGNLLGTVVNNGYEQAKSILDLAYFLVRGGNPPQYMSAEDDKYIMVPYYIVNQDGAAKEIEQRKARESLK